MNKINELIDLFNRNNNLPWPLNTWSAPHNDSRDIPWEEWIKEIQNIVCMLKNECQLKESADVKEQIKTALLNRCTDLRENQARLVKTLTNKRKDQIVIDRVKVQDTNGEDYIAINPASILTAVEKHHENTFKKRHANFDELDESWQQQYLPRDYINPSWYDKIQDEIPEMEFQDVLNNLPHGKAARPSGIHYEMLKKLSKEGKTIIRTFFNCLLKTGLIPGTWKQSTIFPIPKPKPWQCDLANTRPIVLLETTRKCFTKIITNRLSSICKKYNILRGPNFAGLPGESTAEPIQLLNNICEDARENKKELWILFQDIANAYNTVSLEILK